MADSQRQSAPKPWRQFEARTVFLRVPLVDWPSVRQGRKTEFRASGHYASQLWNVHVPALVVAYTMRRVGGYESALLILEATWREPLAAISAESLEREGQPDMAHFRRYWMSRTKQRFAPMKEVHVYRVRPATADELPTLGLALLRRLYQEHL